MQEIREVAIPKEVSDASPQGLAEKINEVVRFLRSIRDVTPPPSRDGVGRAEKQSAKPVQMRDWSEKRGYERIEVKDVFVVKITGHAGSAGDDSSDCSFTYSISAVDGTDLGSGYAPERARYTHVAYTYAPNDSLGIAAMDPSDPTKVVLLVCFGEIEDTDVCE